MPGKRVFIFFKWIFGVLLVFGLLVGAVALYVNIKYRPIVATQIKDAVYKSTDSLYTISFKSVSFNILTGNATLKQVKIIADTNRYKKLLVLKRAPNNVYQLSLKKLAVKHFHPLIFYREKRLQIEELIFDNPEVLMLNKQFSNSNNNHLINRIVETPYALISKSLKELSIDTIKFNDASFKYVNKNQPNTKPFFIRDLNIKMVDLLIDSTSKQDPDRYYLLKDVIIGLNKYVYNLPNKMYNVKLEKLDFHALTGDLVIRDFLIEPLYDEMKFGTMATGNSKDRYTVRLNRLNMKGFDLPKFLDNQTILAEELSLNDGLISVFSNGNLPKNTLDNKLRKFPHQQLQAAKMPILIKQVKLNNVDIHYGVYNKTSHAKGKITFERTTGNIDNVTNMPQIKQKNPKMTAKLTSYLYGQGKLTVNFGFDLLAEDGAFTYAGTLNGFNARALNRITNPVGLVRISMGTVDKLKFNFTANDAGAKGNLVFTYYDLSVALMKYDEKTEQLVTKDIISFLANVLIINPQNPAADGKLTAADVDYLRAPNSSFFNLIWKSLFAGIKHCVGLTEEKQSAIKKHLAEFKAIKESHDLRKQRRLERKRQRAEKLLLNKR